MVESVIPAPERWICALNYQASLYHDFTATGKACDCNNHFFMRLNKLDPCMSCWSAIPDPTWWEKRLKLPVQLTIDEWIWAAMSGRKDAFERHEPLPEKCMLSCWNLPLIRIASLYGWSDLVQFVIQRHPLGVLDMLQNERKQTNMIFTSRDINGDVLPDEVTEWIECQRVMANAQLDIFYEKRSALRLLLNDHLNEILSIPALVNIVYNYLDLLCSS